MLVFMAMLSCPMLMPVLTLVAMPMTFLTFRVRMTIALMSVITMFVALTMLIMLVAFIVLFPAHPKKLD